MSLFFVGTFFVAFVPFVPFVTFGRRGGHQYEWIVRFARAMPGGPQARWTPSRGDVRVSLPSPQCSLVGKDKVKTTTK